MLESIDDLYFDDRYGMLYEKIENGKFIKFELETKNGKVTNRFLIREIPEKINGTSYFDIVTPYGYGGPVIENILGDKQNLLDEYEDRFSKYCNENNIVSEFVRFHPLVKNYIDFEKTYNPIYMRKTLVTKLDEDDVVQNQFGKSCRKNIRQAINKGISFKVTKSPEDYKTFEYIYYSTMDRNNATEYYYFEDEYFSKILRDFKENTILVEAIYEGKTIAAGLYFIYDKTIHIHLSGTLTEYLFLSPAYILRYAVTLWGIENGYKLIHHGGGRSNDENDNLYLFKKNFAKLYDADFYIGKKVWNKEIYDKLCELKNVNKDEEFFPAYRKG